MSIVRYGYYYNQSTQSIPVGNNLLHPMQKIHSEHPDFKLIDERYIYNGFLLFERDVPFSSLDRYIEYGTPVAFVTESKTKISDIPELPQINLNEGTSKEEIEKIPEVVLTAEEIENLVVPEETPIIENKEKEDESSSSINKSESETVIATESAEEKSNKVDISELPKDEAAEEQLKKKRTKKQKTKK